MIPYGNIARVTIQSDVTLARSRGASEANPRLCPIKWTLSRLASSIKDIIAALTSVWSRAQFIAPIAKLDKTKGRACARPFLFGLHTQAPTPMRKLQGRTLGRHRRQL